MTQLSLVISPKPYLLTPQLDYVSASLLPLTEDLGVSTSASVQGPNCIQASLLDVKNRLLSISEIQVGTHPVVKYYTSPKRDTQGISERCYESLIKKSQETFSLCQLQESADFGQAGMNG